MNIERNITFTKNTTWLFKRQTFAVKPKDFQWLVSGTWTVQHASFCVYNSVCSRNFSRVDFADDYCFLRSCTLAVKLVYK